MHRELRETMDITIQDTGTYHTNMLRSVVAGLHEVLQQEPVLVKYHVFVQEPQVAHVVNYVQDNQ